MIRCRALHLVAPLVIAFPLAAQRMWPDPEPQRTVSFSWMRAIQKDFETPSGTAVVNGGSYAMTFAGRVALSPHADFTFEVPITRLNESYPGFALEATKFGNPWLGFESVGTGLVTMVGGVRVGLSGADSANEIEAMHSGSLADFDHYEAWVVSGTGARAGMIVGRVPHAGPFITGQVGGSIMLPVVAFESKQTSLIYGVRGGVVVSGIQASVAFTGRYFTTGPVLDDNSVGELSFAVRKATGRLRPHVEYRVFTTQGYRDMVSGVVNVGFTLGH